MHARSGAWRCCDGKGRGARVQCELFLAATLLSVELWISIHTYCWEAAKIHKPRSLNYCSIANQRVLFFAMPFLPYKGFGLMGHLKTDKCECLRSRANRHVQMFVKQPNRRLQCLLAVENKKILQQLKRSALYMMFQLTLIFYPHHAGMHSEMLYPNRRFEICQERIFVKQHRKNGWSIYLLPK